MPARLASLFLSFRGAAQEISAQARTVQATLYIFCDENTHDIRSCAQTNLFGEVAYHVRATDNAEPGRDDILNHSVGA